MITYWDNVPFCCIEIDISIEEDLNHKLTLIKTIEMIALLILDTYFASRVSKYIVDKLLWIELK